jgi:hypothetical protein
MAGAGEEFLGGSTIHQIVVWGVLVELLTSIMQPAIREIEQSTNAAFPNVRLDPATLADLVVKGWLAEGDAAATAKDSGIPPGDFDLMVKGVGEPIGLQDAIFAMRRGIIPFAAPTVGAPSVETAIKTSHIANLWSDTIKALALVPIGVADAVDAVVEGQIPYADGEAIAGQNGIDPANFRILFNTRGNPPGPSDLIELVRRGLIPMQGTGPNALSLQQGIYEGATKDKWEPLYEQLVRYVPPPRTVTAVYKAGGYTAAQATQLYMDAGLSAADAAAYIAGASGEKITGTVQTSVATINTLYFDHAIDNATAVGLLGHLGYSPQEAAFELSVQDLKRSQTALNSAIGRIGTLFINRKIDGPTATEALASLKVPADQAVALIQTWTIEAGANVKLLTETQVVDAWAYGNMTLEQAEAGLEALGYTPFDAWVLLSNKNKGPLGNAPPAGPAPFYTAPS